MGKIVEAMNNCVTIQTSNAKFTISTSDSMSGGHPPKLTHRLEEAKDTLGRIVEMTSSGCHKHCSEESALRSQYQMEAESVVSSRTCKQDLQQAGRGTSHRNSVITPVLEKNPASIRCALNTNQDVTNTSQFIAEPRSLHPECNSLG